MINLNKSGIYLVKPRGNKLRPIDLDKRRIHKVIKANDEFLKFGKSERALNQRYNDYKKIFGSDVIFKPIVVFNDMEKLRKFEKIVSQSFNKYKVSNPNSSYKLEWMKNIEIKDAIEIIKDKYKEFHNNNSLI